MALIALLSAKGSPGVTTTAVALTVAWPERVILVEADPAGGDLLAGFLGGELGAQIGLAELAVAELRGSLPQTFWGQLVDLEHDRRRKLLLPGIVDPAQSTTVASVLPSLTGFFTAMEHAEPSYDVIVDCGRLVAPNVPWPLLKAADAVLLVVNGSLPSVSAAVPALRELRKAANLGTRADVLGVLVREGDLYKPAEVAKRLDLPLVGALPEDRSTARVVARGGELRSGATLVKAARHIHATLTAQIAQRRIRTPIPQEAQRAGV